MSAPPPAPAAAALPSPRRGVRASLRLIVPLASALLLAAAMLGGAVVSERQTRGLLVDATRARLALEAELLARASASAMLEGFPELTLQPILRDLLRGRGELSAAYVLDRDGRVLAHPDTRRIGQRMPVPQRAEDAPAGPVLREEGDAFVAVMPVRHAGKAGLGHAVVVMPRAPLERALAETRLRLWWITALLVLASGTITFTLMSRLLRPVTRLREGLERIGSGDLESRLAMRDSTELGLLADTLDEMAGRLSIAQRSQLERERLAAELEAAGRIQGMLRPPDSVRRGAYVVTGHQRPAAEVGGDYFDVLELADGRLGLVIADVAGKGLAGCLVTFMLAALVRATRERETSPTRLLLEVDRHLRPVLARGAFVTVWYGVLDPLSGTLTFASAGHLPTFVRRTDGRVERYATRGVPLGILTPEAVARGLQDATVRLAPGDTVLQLTDGYTEAERPGDAHQLGFDGIDALLARSGAGQADAVLAELRERVVEWTHDAPPGDDQTAIVIAREAEPARGGAAALGAAEAEAWVMRARTQHAGLALRADFAELERLRPWLETEAGLAGLAPRGATLLESALYELCGNVVEHGYGCDGRGVLELWWLADDGSAEPGPDGMLLKGRFVLREDGRSFDPASAPAVDLARVEARKRGRGLGLEMLRRITSAVRYCAGTAVGNVTLLEIDSEEALELMKGLNDARCA